jgi:hypothetical protein
MQLVHAQLSKHLPRYQFSSCQVVRLISIACVSPEASAAGTAPLRKRFVEALLERGLLNVMADILADYDNQYMHQVGPQC